MALACRWILVLTVLLAGGQRLAAANATENRAFKAAVDALHDGFYHRAETEFAGFIQKYPNSTLLSDAILCQAQARLELTNYAGALELLSANLGSAGTNADQYLFWQAETWRRQGDFKQAADMFDRLVNQFPSSSRRLEAGLAEADARSRLGDWPRVIELLEATNGVFQSAARAAPASRAVVRGRLLLSEAHLAQHHFAAATEALAPLANAPLSPADDWERQYLLCRILLAEDRPDDALQGATNLLALAARTAQRRLQAESVAFYAGLLERLGHTAAALSAYQENLADGVSPERQRQALLKISELSLAQEGQPAAAAQTVETFLTQHPDSPSADVALLSLGELRLRQYAGTLDTNRLSSATTNAPAGTNALDQALTALQTFTNRFPQSPLLGKASLDLGWCYGLQGKLPESRASFLAAVGRLPLSADLATAYFKLADAEFEQQDFTNARIHYHTIVEKFGALAEVKTNLFEPALYQTVRAALAAGDLDAATNALDSILAWYPEGFHTDAAVLLTGEALTHHQPAAARKMFLDFVRLAPLAPLRPRIELAIARTYEQQNQWPDAIAVYDSVLARSTNHDVVARADYGRAWASFQGHQTNAFTLFTNFIAHFPTNELTPQAQLWVADHQFRNGNWFEAEKDYQLLARTWPGTDLAWQAQMMAGRAAVARESYGDAAEYFTNLYFNANCPADLRLQAFFAYGDTLMSRASPDTNRLANYQEAIRVFNNICESYPTNPVAVLAWGELAYCQLQWAQYSKDYSAASNAFQRVIDSPRADFTARSIARVGLGVVLEKQAEQQTGAVQTASLKLALNQYLDVFYFDKTLRDGEQPDWFWVKKAGLAARNLTEALQEWDQLLHVCERLQELLPALGPSLEKPILKARTYLERQQN